VADKPRSDADHSKQPDEQFRVAAPQPSLQKRAGAIRGIGEKFAANPVTATGP